MSDNRLTWIASYPRSGNTFLRTILWHCFGLRSASVYPDDLGGNTALEQYVGHIGHDDLKGLTTFPGNGIPLFKTHEHPIDDNPAIYVIRDGRAAAVSLWKFYDATPSRKRFSMEDIIEGRHKFGTWSSHVQAWAPCERNNTLLLKYEDMESDLPGTLDTLNNFLNRDIVKHDIPDRNSIADAPGKWVRKKTDWRAGLSNDQLTRFNELNRDMLIRMGYL